MYVDAFYNSESVTHYNKGELVKLSISIENNQYVVRKVKNCPKKRLQAGSELFFKTKDEISGKFLLIQEI